jgi:hypothetical protein
MGGLLPGALQPTRRAGSTAWNAGAAEERPAKAGHGSLCGVTWRCARDGQTAAGLRPGIPDSMVLLIFLPVKSIRNIVYVSAMEPVLSVRRVGCLLLSESRIKLIEQMERMSRWGLEGPFGIGVRIRSVVIEKRWLPGAARC